MPRIQECALMTWSSQVRVKSPVSSLFACNSTRCETTLVVAKLILLPKISSKYIRMMKENIETDGLKVYCVTDYLRAGLLSDSVFSKSLLSESLGWSGGADMVLCWSKHETPYSAPYEPSQPITELQRRTKSAPPESVVQLKLSLSCTRDPLFWSKWIQSTILLKQGQCKLKQEWVECMESILSICLQVWMKLSLHLSFPKMARADLHSLRIRSPSR